MASPPTANRRTKSRWASSRGSTTRSASSNKEHTGCSMKSTFGSKSSPACCQRSDASPSFWVRIHPHDFTKSRKYNGWDFIPGQIIDTPNCVSWGPNRLDCFARGPDTQVWNIGWDGTQWGNWESLGAPPSGGILDAPNCVSWGTNRIDCFVRGGDKAMWHIAGDGTQWGGWESLGAPSGGILNAPNCVSWGPNRLDCFPPGAYSSTSHNSLCASTSDAVLAVSS